MLTFSFAALRFVAGWVWSLGLALAFCLCCPLLGARRMWCALRTAWARVSLVLVAVRLNVIGQANLIEPAVYIVNHESLMDVVIVPAVVPAKTLFVAKKSLRLIPFWGWAFAAGGALLIDRRNARAARDTLIAGAQQLPAAWSVAVFPEGTRSRDGQLQRFKRGAFVVARASNRPIVPIALVGARETVARNGWFVRGGQVTVCIGSPLPAATHNALPLREHIAAGEAAVAAAVAEGRAAMRAATPQASPGPPA